MYILQETMLVMWMWVWMWVMVRVNSLAINRFQVQFYEEGGSLAFCEIIATCINVCIKFGLSQPGLYGVGWSVTKACKKHKVVV